MHFPRHIFREYDIRGTVGTELTEPFSYALGRVFGAQIVASGNATACVGYDGRLSSPALSLALIAGLSTAGVAVMSVGCGPTPMLYYATCATRAGGGVMVTGSHNPPDQNGFKMMLGSAPFFGPEIQALMPRMAAVDLSGWPCAQPSCEEAALAVRYLAALREEAVDIGPLTVVWDPGNGATGEIIQALTSTLPGTHHLINAAIDGTFPAHHPDPSEPHNLEQLVAEVRTRGAALGIAFDGDGDRIGAVDAHGEMVAGDRLLMLFAKDMLGRCPGAEVIADVKSSLGVRRVVEAAGGRMRYWKTGHSNIKMAMKASGALLAGEMSGHMFFAENYFGFDDALLASVRLLRLLSRSGRSLAAHLEDLPQYVATPELRIPCSESEKFAIIARIAARLEREERAHIAIDGVRVETPEGWWLLRASNTQAIVVGRVEATTSVALTRLRAEMENYLSAAQVAA